VVLRQLIGIGTVPSTHTYTGRFTCQAVLGSVRIGTVHLVQAATHPSRYSPGARRCGRRRRARRGVRGGGCRVAHVPRPGRTQRPTRNAQRANDLITGTADPAAEERAVTLTRKDLARSSSRASG
jgi:hypothetical protein